MISYFKKLNNYEAGNSEDECSFILCKKINTP